MTAQADNFASLTDARIMARLGEIKRQVNKVGEELGEIVHSRVAAFLQTMLGDLAADSCRIAVIGQIKAGKSTLINAIIRRPHLLPTDINPSTAVITKLHFGAAPEQNNSALFHFFSDQEWERIMSGGRTGALTMQRHSVIKQDQLQAPLEELRQRAETRLGSEYSNLLGKHHLFSAVTSSVLERYVSAGDYEFEGEQTADEDHRHFSDITKIAEVFLEGQPLGYPSVIIDTPGVNDPFLVRDEITHGNLGDADIYLVVLTAQQPLSKSDLALLRMLKGLQKDKIIAVVNRIDIIDDIARKGDEITQHVQAALKREFPYTEIPVILASAFWGNAALSDDEEEFREALSPAFKDYVAEMARRGEIGFTAPAEDWSQDHQTQQLYRASGIPAIISAMSRLIGHSVTAERLMPVASTIGAIAENTAISVRHGIKSLQAGDPLNDRSGGSSWLRGQALNNLQQLEHMLAQLEDALLQAEQAFTAMTEEELTRLRKFMHYTIENFAERQREMLIAAGSFPAFRSVFQEQSFQLRSQLAEDFYKYITEIAKQFLSRQQEAEAMLRQTMKQALPSLDDVLHFGIQSGSLPPPSIISLSKITAVDLDDFWLPGALPLSNDEAGGFKRSVIAAFSELIDDLFQESDATLRNQITDAVRRLRFLSYSAIYPIAQQLQELVQAHHSAEATKGKNSAILPPVFWEQFLNECKKHLERCETLATEAADARRRCIHMMDD